MEYRAFGQTNFKPSALGFGLMRLPVIGDNQANIDQKQAEKMVHFAIDSGVNYLDTAYVYHQGQSEVFLGKALKNGYREKVKIATKLPIWATNSIDNANNILDEELKRLGTEHIDFYLLHSLDKEKWQKVLRLDLISWAEQKIQEGKIGAFGFSFHDQLPLFKEIIDSYKKWNFCLIQYNFIDENFQAGKEGLKYAHEKGLGVVIMEPLKGGKLADSPKEILRIWDKSEKKRTPVNWALSWLWNQPEVSLVISGMSSLSQVEDNIKYAEQSGVGILNEEELKLFEEVKEGYQKLIPVPCTGCKYCLPCPAKVNIPEIFKIYNEGTMFADFKSAQNKYSKLNPEEKAENCISCRKCESLCPQKIKIPEELKKAVKVLTNNK